MSPLAYTILGIIVESTVKPVNETGNTGTLSAIWTLADRPADSVTYGDVMSAITELDRAGLLERVESAALTYRLASPAKAA